MSPARIFWLSASLLFGLGGCISGQTQIREVSIECERLFKEGKFAEAEKACRSILAREPNNFQTTLLRGRIALLDNKLDEAEKWLTAANKLKSDSKEALPFLAEVFYRRDEFERAAPLLRTLGKEAMAKQLESFRGLVPYELVGKAQALHLKFVNTDPLPLVSIRVNHSEEVNFLIDTGGSEVIVDSEFAEKTGVRQFGQDLRTFGGGKAAAIAFGHIDSLTLGDLEVRNVPAHVLSTQPFSGAARGKPVSGVIGTVFLYHFLATLDYPSGQLILKRRTKKNLRQLETRAKIEKQIVIPFWMAGDHFMVDWGRVGKSAPVLLFVDTGLAGGGYTGPRSVLDEAGIKLSEEKASEGVGGGGRIKIVPFDIDELALSGARERNLKGFFGPFPMSLEYSLGFRVGGIISHQFFRPYALTFDFTGMRLFLKKQA